MDVVTYKNSIVKGIVHNMMLGLKYYIVDIENEIEEFVQFSAESLIRDGYNVTIDNNAMIVKW